MAEGRRADIETATDKSSWSDRYSKRHKLVRVDLPEGVVAPEKVRIYARAEHYVLQWWDPAAKKNLSDRVNGDFIAAISRAREIDERIRNFRASGHVSRRLGHADLIAKYLENLGKRADAGEIKPGTVERYRAALGHYEAFLERPDVASRYAYAAGIDRDLALEFTAFLNARTVTPNGAALGDARLMTGQGFVLDTIRAMLEWAADPERGKLLPEGFRNPFLGASRRLGTPADDCEAEPDITTDMAIEFISTCDEYQLRLFAPMILYGLRPGEPCFVFREHVDADLLRVNCLPDLVYATKGQRNKALPVIDVVRSLLLPPSGASPDGPLFLRRRVLSGHEGAPLSATPLEEIAAEFSRRCATSGVEHMKDRLRVRDQVMRDAGAITYKTVEREFKKVARKLGWPRDATDKDFRHHFATSMENGGVPEQYRKYLMGHSRGNAAIVRYTHLNKVRARYEAAVEREWPELVAALERRVDELGLTRTGRDAA
jgi:integrase